MGKHLTFKRKEPKLLIENYGCMAPPPLLKFTNNGRGGLEPPMCFLHQCSQAPPAYNIINLQYPCRTIYITPPNTAQHNSCLSIIDHPAVRADHKGHPPFKFKCHFAIYTLNHFALLASSCSNRICSCSGREVSLAILSAVIISPPQSPVQHLPT